MKFLRRLILQLALLAVVALLGYLAYLHFTGKPSSLFGLSFNRPLQAEPTPMRI